MLRITINSHELEILNEFDLGLVLDKRAVDVSQPFARLGSRSYTVRFPATDLNNEIFHHGNAKFTKGKFNDFDCVCYDGETELIKGTFRLNKIDRTSYEGFIFAQDIGFIDIIDGKSIQELDLGSIRFVGHKKDDEIKGVTLSDTWESDFEYFQNAWFALISYGNFFSLDARDRYAKIDELTFTDFTPNHQLKTVFRKIFEEAGYSVSGEIVDSLDLDNIMLTFSGDKVPWNWELLTKVLIDNSQTFNTNFAMVGDTGSTGNALIDNKRRYYLKDVAETKDHLNRYDNANVINNPIGQEWTCPREGIYRFDITMQTTQTVIGDGLDDANALEQAKHNKLVLLNADNADTLDANSSLFTSTTTPYANTSAGGGEVDYLKANDLTLGINETAIIKYTVGNGGGLNAFYDPLTGEYTAQNDESILMDCFISNPDINLEFTVLVNGVPSNARLQDFAFDTNNNPYLIAPITKYFSTFPHPAFPWIGVDETPLQLQAGDKLSFQLKNRNGSQPVTILANQFSNLIITTGSLSNRPVPIYETSDLIKAYIEPWKGSGETAEEKTGGSVSSDYERLSIEFSNNGFSGGAGSYSYTTDIEYSFTVKCDRGELLKFAMLTYNDNIAYTYEAITVNDFEFVIQDGSGETFNFANALPNISQRDFATDVIQTFNIYPLINETNKSISFVKRADYFKRSNPVKFDYSLHSRTFTPSKTPRNLYLGLAQVEDDYSDELEGLRLVNPNPNAPNDNTATFASKFMGQAFKRLYSIQGNPIDSKQFQIPSISVGGSREILRADVGEWELNTPMRLVRRGDGLSYKTTMQSLEIAGVLIDEILFNVLPLSTIDSFVSFKDGSTIFGNYWSDIYLYQSAE
ncbi:hypothetical protein N9251_03325, partial [Gammaproteobacteria bacterium]|nr:hypothetical protein [Gammaproteobacteria bacterium]